MELVEITEQARESIVAAMEAITLYLSILTGYLIVAYTVGKNLSKFQLIIITALFLTFSTFFVLGTYMFFMRAHDMNLTWRPESYTGQNAIFALWIGGAQLAGIIASLAFMYDAQKK